MLLSMDIPTTEPTSFTAGDTVKWTREISDYPADQYALKYVLQLLSGGTPIEISAAADGSSYAVTISAASSAAYAVGDYRWYGYVTDLATGLERYSIGSGSLTVLPDPAAFTTATDLRSHARKVLAAIEATLEGTATRDQLKMQIDGEMIERRTIAELLQLRSFYAAEVRREEQAEKLAKGIRTNNIIRTRFL